MQLKPLTEQDLDMILEWRNAPAVRQNMYTNRLISHDEHRAWFERLNGDDNRQYFIFVGDGKARGVVGFTQIDRVSRRASWAFYAAPNAPRGTGSLMEFCALEYAFGELALHRLHCEVLNFNLPVVRLHQTFGFKVEGTLRDHHYDGARYCDVVLLGIMEKEWLLQRTTIRQRLRLKEGNL